MIKTEDPWANYIPPIIPPFVDLPETPRFTDPELASMEKWAGHCPGCPGYEPEEEEYQ